MEKTSQIIEVRVDNRVKVDVSKDKVKNSEVDNRPTVKATFSQLIADTKVLKDNKYEWFWVANDKLAPKEAGKYEIIRNKDPDGFIRLSIKKASDERWAELAKTPENKLYVSEAAANRSGRLAVYVDFWGDGLDLDALSGAEVAARVAEVEQAQAAPNVLKPRAGETLEITLRDGQKMQIDATEVKVVRRQ